jgi:hypothetical protein
VLNGKAIFVEMNFEDYAKKLEAQARALDMSETMMQTERTISKQSNEQSGKLVNSNQLQVHSSIAYPQSH